MNSQSSEADVALIIDADTDAGYWTAQRLLEAGYRVVVTAQHAAGLTRILHGHSASRVVAFAATHLTAVRYNACSVVRKTA
jgi:predicted kinase